MGTIFLTNDPQVRQYGFTMSGVPGVVRFMDGRLSPDHYGSHADTIRAALSGRTTYPIAEVHYFEQDEASAPPPTAAPDGPQPRIGPLSTASLKALRRPR